MFAVRFSAHDKKKEDEEGRRRLELTIHTTWENSCRALALGKMKNIAVRHPRRTKSKKKQKTCSPPHPPVPRPVRRDRPGHRQTFPSKPPL